MRYTFSWLGCLVIAMAAGCSPTSGPTQLGVVRVALQGGTMALHDVPAGTDGIFLTVDSVDIRVDGTWQTHAISTTINLLQPDIRPLLRSVPRFSTVDSIRLVGSATLSMAGERLDLQISSERGLQINMDQPALAGHVTRITLSLDGTIHYAQGAGWILRPLLKGTVESDAEAFAVAHVTPQNGGTLSLSNGFELVVPPSTVDQPVDIYVEAIPDDDTEPFYELGPAGLQFAGPVEAHVPWANPSDGLTWDGEEPVTWIDPQGRVVAENTHFSCLDKGFRESSRTIGQGAQLFEGKMCGAMYSIGVVPLKATRIRVRGVIGAASSATPNQCVGQRVFKTESVTSFLSKVPNRSYTPVIAISGDAIGGDEDWKGDVADACAISRTIVSGDVIREFPNRRFNLGFGAGNGNGTAFGVSDDIDPERTDFSVFGSGYRYIRNGRADFAYPYRRDELTKEEYELLADTTSRAAIGVSRDSSYLFMGVADSRWSGMDGYQWVRVWLHGRQLPNGASVTPYTAWRMDEGQTPNMAYYDHLARQTKQVNGALTYADDTVLAIAVFEGACADRCAKAPVRGWYCGSKQELCWCDSTSQPTAVLGTNDCVFETQGTQDHDSGEPAPCLATCAGAPQGSMLCCGEGGLQATCEGGKPIAVVNSNSCP